MWNYNKQHGGNGSGNPIEHIGVADGETEFNQGQILISKINGKFYDVDTDAIVSEPAGDANCSIRVQQERLVVDLDTSNAATISLIIKTNDDQPYEIDKKDGNGYVTAASNVSQAMAYDPVFTGQVSIRFAPDQYPIEFKPTGEAWVIKSESSAKLNKYNTLEVYNVANASVDQVILSDLIHAGSNLTALSVFNPAKAFKDNLWSKDLALATKLTYLFIFVVSAKPEQGTIDLDDLRFPDNSGTMYFNTTGLPMFGDLSEFIGYHSEANNYVLLGDKAASNITVSNDTFVPKSEMVTLTTNLLDTTAKIDAVLKALANRPNPSWISSKSANFSLSDGIPSAQGLSDKAIIEAQPGNPSVLVNS